MSQRSALDGNLTSQSTTDEHDEASPDAASCSYCGTRTSSPAWRTSTTSVMQQLWHTDIVTSVAVTGDGRSAVSGSLDQTVRVWDLDGGRCPAVLEGHKGWVTGVAVTGDGRTAVSGSLDQTVRVWDLALGRCSAVLEGHTGSVRSVAVTRDGRTAVSVSWDRTVRVWDLDGGRCSASHAEGSEETRRVWDMAKSGLASTAAIEPYGLVLRDTTNGVIFARFPGSFSDAVCSSDGRHVVAGDGRGGVYLLRLHRRRS
jgi:WD40 repeat protein